MSGRFQLLLVDLMHMGGFCFNGLRPGNVGKMPYSRTFLSADTRKSNIIFLHAP
jgi:hypothetical protein